MRQGDVQWLIARSGMYPLRGWLDGRTADELQDVASAALRIDREKREADMNADKQMRMEELEQ